MEDLKTNEVAEEIEDVKTDEVETTEEIKAEDEKKYTDKDIDEIVNKKFAKWQKEKEKEISEAKKLADMNATEKIEYERDQLKAKLEELEKANALNEMGKTARNILADENINISDELINVLITDDAETTKTNVDGFIALFKSEVDKAVTEKLKAPTPKRGNTLNKLTKGEILNIKDPIERQSTIAENIELFK